MVRMMMKKKIFLNVRGFLECETSRYGRHKRLASSYNITTCGTTIATVANPNSPPPPPLVHDVYKFSNPSPFLNS
jgi:hypothetical protein